MSHASGVHACYIARVAGRGSRRVVQMLSALAALGLLLWSGARALVPSSTPALCEALAKRRVVEVFAAGEVDLRCEGVRLERADGALVSALAQADETALIAALRRHKASAIAVAPGQRDGVRGRLAAREHVAGMRGVVLSPELSVYAPAREVELSFEEREALAYVARALLRGAREPNVASFPPSLRRVERVEVMVLLSRRGEPRLWRSARATSIARGLLTASRVARDRWREREQAMGGPLAKQLLELDVEVLLLSEDGTLLGRQSAFVDQAVKPQHGIGFDHRTSWHYVLPRDLPRQGGAYKALTQQLGEQGLTLAALDSDARIYRFLPQSLAVSKAPLGDHAPR
jgi:hypothetical protein